MTVQVQELIDKIKNEGIQQAENKAADIEAQAQKIAEDIVKEAKQEKERILKNAKQEAERFRASAEAAILQASRDMILSLHKKIEQTLQTLISTEVKASLSSEQLGEIIAAVIKEYVKDSSKADIKVYLNKSDAEKLSVGVLKKLQSQIKQPIEFESAGDVDKGFVISFDGGKSSFDFSDQSLSEYIGAFLNEEVSGLLKKAVSA